MAMLTAIYVAYHFLLLLLSAGTTDFDGKPYGLDDYIVVGMLFITLVTQLFMLARLVKRVSSKTVFILAGSAYLYWVTTILVYGGIESLLFPTVYAAPLLLLYGGYSWVTKSSMRKTKAS